MRYTRHRSDWRSPLRMMSMLGTAIDFMVHLFWNSGTLWQTSNLETRQGLQKAIFPGGLKYSEDTGFGTALSDFYTVVCEQPTRGGNGMVRPEGFEPPAY